MNKTEAAYALELEALRSKGLLAWWRFEGVKLRLADATFYTPDFVVMQSSGVLAMHEVKGFMTDKANVKLKVAASLFPFRFVLVRQVAKKNGGGWAYEEVGS